MILWASSERRKDQNSEEKLYSHVQIEIRNQNQVSLSHIATRRSCQKRSICRLLLSHGGVISREVPVPERGLEVGVEMSL